MNKGGNAPFIFYKISLNSGSLKKLNFASLPTNINLRVEIGLS
jgi:hypothetical protein